MQLTQGLHRAVQQHPRQTAFVCGERRRDWATFTLRVARLAGLLRAHGVARGDRVALLAANSDRAVEALVALWWLGAVAVPLNLRWSQPELLHAVDECEARLLLVEAAWQATAESLCLQAPARLVRPLHLLPLDAALDARLDAAAPVEDAEAGGDDLAAILYTGGTTGRAKGVMLSHANFWVTSVARMAEILNPRHWTSLIVAPLFHVAGLGRLVSQLVTGATTVLLPTFDAEAALAAIEREAVNDVVFVPTMLQRVLDAPACAPARLRSLQRIIYGASPIAPVLLERAMRSLPQVGFVQAYGMTETAATVCSGGPELHTPEGLASGRIRSVGRAGFSVQLKVVDEADREVARGEVGELLVKGPNVMLGYWKQPEETARALRDGWYHTGDGARMDDEGLVYIVDRLKDMIVTGGENVYSAEVEAVLLRHPGISQCAVIAVPSEAWGEAVHAVVVPQAGVALDEDAVKRHCHAQLAGYKCPKRVEFRAALPMSAAGKVLKHALRAPHWPDPARGVR